MNGKKILIYLIVLFVLATMIMGYGKTQDSKSCEPSDVFQQIDVAIADYQQTRRNDDLTSALEDWTSFIESSIGIFSVCIPGLEDLSNGIESNSGSSEEPSSENRNDGGAGTFANPVKDGWAISDGEGRWIQPLVYARVGNQICTPSLNGRCEQADPGNEFVAVIIFGKCDDSRSTRCKFSHYGEFELAGERGIPYNVWSSWEIEDVYEIFPDDILPGGEAQGVVVFQARSDEFEFKFGWTPDYSSGTTWFGPLIEYSEPSQTTTTNEPAPDRAIVQSNSLNVRSGPGTNFARVGSLISGESVSVIGRNSSGTWIQIDKGWVSAQYLSWPSAIDFMALPVTSN